MATNRYSIEKAGHAIWYDHDIREDVKLNSNTYPNSRYESNFHFLPMLGRIIFLKRQTLSFLGF